jgi:predicted Zn-dependent peptidase
MLNRKIPPPIKLDAPIQLKRPDQYTLDNGINVYGINAGSQEVIKLEVVFRAGRPYEKKHLVSRATADQLKEGTSKHTAAAIAEHFDYYGSTLSLPFNLDTSNVVVYCMTKHFEKIIPLLGEILNAPAFPEHELSSFIQRNQQRLNVDLSKNDVVAYRTITELIFGTEHPYGYNSYADTYKNLDRSDLVTHFQDNYTAENCFILISGRINTKIIQLLNQYLGQAIPKGQKNTIQVKAPQGAPVRKKINQPDTVQTAIRIGRDFHNRHHPDYKGMYVLNTILGGYFGSRLMNNIREEKGYTYNIYSLVDSMQFSGCFYIGTEVGNEFVDQTVEEVYKEMAILQQELIDKQELEMVKNYLLGYYLTLVDGPFNIAEVIKAQITDELPIHFFEDLVQYTSEIDVIELQRLAQKYLSKKDMWEVIVGA